MVINPQRGNLCTITDIVFFLVNRQRREMSFFSPQNRHTTSNTTMTIQHTTTDKRQHNRHETTTRHDTTQRNATQHDATQHTTPRHKHATSTSPSPAQVQAHFIPSGTRLAQGYPGSCFLHIANMFARQGVSHGPCTLALKASQDRVCTESQLDERFIVMVIEKRERADERQTSRQETDEQRERERQTDRQSARDPPVCTFKTLLCVPLNRPCLM